jgi:hypothetical protein
MHRVRPIADADGEDRLHARGARALQHGLAVIVIAGAVEMAWESISMAG